MKFRYKEQSIRYQILLISVGLSITLIVFLLSFSASQILHSKNAMREMVNANRSVGVVEKVDRNFYERFGDVQAFAYNRLALQTVDSGRASFNAQNFINTMVSYYVLYDLMMILDVSGKVVAVNTMDKYGVPVKSDFLIGKDFSNEGWFRVCLSEQGPSGGAWYSDFQKNGIVSQIYSSNGYGMAFAAPIKSDDGEVLGVWYNYANWGDVVQGIRSETEQLLQQEYTDSFILITDKDGKVIDCDDELLIGDLLVNETLLGESDFFFSHKGKKISSSDYIYSTGQGRGAYTYKGNNWKAFTFVPKEKFTMAIFWGELKSFSMFVIGILFCGIVAFLLFAKNISRRISLLQGAINSTSRGELPNVDSTDWSDEVGQMTNAVKALINGLKETSRFSNEIGKGNLDIKFSPLSENDVLGHSLVTMRNDLKSIRAEDERRKWIAQGLAEFGEKLRKNSDSIAILCDHILVYLCKYMNANQGAIFVKDVSETEQWLEMVACYAWNRKKYLEVKIDIGEGLVGQVCMEGELLYMTKVPENFVRITSGLGEVTPGSVILIPLKMDEEVLGVLELASLEEFLPHEIEFLQKVSEGLAASLSSVKTNERTRALLEQTQIQAESLRAQEEEMRQNLEEMQATQEEFVRRENEYIAKIKHFNKNASKDEVMR